MIKSNWNQLISSVDPSHLLQTRQWAASKSKVGWTPYYLAWFGQGNDLELLISDTGDFDRAPFKAAALILKRIVGPGLTVLYVPKGPLLDNWNDPELRKRVFSDLERFAKQQRAIQIKIDPDVVLGIGESGAEEAEDDLFGMRVVQEITERGWLFSPEQIQFRNTVLIDLQSDEDDILSRMKSKTRYNIRLSSRKGVQTRLGSAADLVTLYQMYARTSIRGGFTIRSEEYYTDLWGRFIPDDGLDESDPVAQPLIAEFEGQPIAGAVIFKFGTTAYYMHGMSVPEHSEKMAPHLIQWEAMRWAKSKGCEVYDMWGAPNEFVESDPMWGVYRFKNGFAGQVTRTIGAWDFPSRTIAYRLYHLIVPLLLSVMRWLGKRRTGHSARSS